MKKLLKRIFISFSISCLAGLLTNLFIDLVVNASGAIENFVSIPPDFRTMFRTDTIAAYTNILLYGLIGASFAGMTFVFEIDKIGFLLQYLIYFCTTGTVLAFITGFLWKLQNVPMALVSTLAGYGVAFLIMGITEYKATKTDIRSINEMIGKE